MQLKLDDGTTIEGTSFGADRAVSGEVVFNTAMTGYIETLTDPSYAGQILVMTYPLIGNYGVPADRGDDLLGRPFESSRVQVQGLVVQSYSDDFSHYRAARSLGNWLQLQGIPAMTGVDTRRLTRHLREYGTMNGCMLQASGPNADAVNAASVDMEREVFLRVAPKELTRHGADQQCSRNRTALLVDIGAKDNICRSLLSRGVNVMRAPWHLDLRPCWEEADGVVIGNGPGDPQRLGELVAQVRDLMRSAPKPLFGICLGNQVLALAVGATTFKLPYGHRGVNQPVQDLFTRRSFITSQNHGYAVDDDSLPEEWETWFVNINDGTNEGIRCRGEPYFGVQFHPEASPGPEDTAYLFDEFVKLL